MIRLVRSEIIRLARPAVLWLGIGMAAISVFVGSMSQEPIASTIKEYRIGWKAAHVSPPDRGSLGLPPAASRQVYQNKLDAYFADMQALRNEVVESGARSGASQHPLGAAGLAAGFAASMLGGLFVMLVAAVHVAGEWSGRTVKELLVRDGRRYRFVVAKAIALWIAGVWLFACSWLALIVMGQVGQRIWRIPTHESPAMTLTWAGPMVGRALLVLALFAAIGTLAGVLVRSPIGTFLAGMLALTTMVFAGRTDFQGLSPALWASSWMGFERITNFYDHPLWPDADPALAGSWAGLGVLALTAVVVGFACLSTRRRDSVS